MVEAHESLGRSPLFEHLPEPRRERLLACSRMRRYDCGTFVFVATDDRQSVYLLLSGRVRLYHVTPDGRQALLAIIDPGELFGELALVASGERGISAEPMEPADVLVLPADEVRALMDSDPRVARCAAELIGRRHLDCERRLMSLLFRPVCERLIALLLDLADKYGRPADGGVLLDIPLSQQDLADAIGSTRESVSTALSAFQSENLVFVDRRRIVLRDTKRLSERLGRSAPAKDATG